MKKKMILITAAACLLLAVLGIWALYRHNYPAIPNVLGTDEETAKTILINHGFIPVVEYGYSDTADIGTVFYMEPRANSSAKRNSSVSITVSRGSSNAKVWHIRADDLEEGFEDDWDIQRIYIANGQLCVDVSATFGVDMEWAPIGNSPDFIGAAAPDSSFNIPSGLYIDADETAYSAGETCEFTLITSIDNLGRYQPNQIYYKMFTDHGEIILCITMGWH